MAQNAFFQELKRRNVFKVASIYAVTAWLIIQVAAVAFPAFELPIWTQRLVIILALIGFPIALILAWVQQSKATLSENQIKWNNWVLSAIILAIGLLAFTVWRFSAANESRTMLPSEIRNEKVGVGIFENFTSDENLDALGYLASEWITSSLRELNIETISPEMMREYRDFVTIFPNNPQGKPAFVDITGAKYLISGSYFDHGQDSIRLNTRLLDTRTGEEIQEFPILWSKKSRKEELIEEARQRLMGYWAAKRDQHFPKVRPPKYEAYQAYLECQPARFYCFNNIVSIDSTFLLNRINVMWSATWFNQDSSYESSKSYLEDHWDRCTNYEKLFFETSEFFWKGDYQGAFEGLNQLYLLDTLNLYQLNELGSLGVFFVNRPEIVLEASETLFNQYETFREKIWGNIFWHYFEALNLLGQNQKLISFCEGLPGQDLLEKPNSNALFVLYKAYLENGQSGKAVELIEKMLDNEDDVSILIQASYGWNTFYKDTIADPFAEKILNKLDEIPNLQQAGYWGRVFRLGTPPYLLRESLAYWQKDWPKAEKEIMNLKKIDPDTLFPKDNLSEFMKKGFLINIESMLGMTYARQGKVESALQQMERLETMRETFPKVHTPAAKGFISYRQAKIQALLGNKEKAVYLLKQALEEGFITAWWRLRFDWDLAGLRGYEPYEALLRPKINLRD